MAKKQKQQEENLQDQFREYREEDVSILKKKSIKELIAPSGIDASNIDKTVKLINKELYLTDVTKEEIDNAKKEIIESLNWIK